MPNLAAGGHCDLPKLDDFRQFDVGPAAAIYFFNGGTLLIENSTISGNTSRNTAERRRRHLLLRHAGPAGVTIRNTTDCRQSATDGNGGGIPVPPPQRHGHHSRTARSPAIRRFGGEPGSTATAAAAFPSSIQTAARLALIIIQSSIVSGNSCECRQRGSRYCDLRLPAAEPDRRDDRPFGNRRARTGSSMPTRRHQPAGRGQPRARARCGTNGGPTQTMALPAGSPAIDAGSNPAAADDRSARVPVASEAARASISAPSSSSPAFPPRTHDAGQRHERPARPRIRSRSRTPSTGSPINLSDARQQRPARHRAERVQRQPDPRDDQLDEPECGGRRLLVRAAGGDVFDRPDNGNYTVAVQASQVANATGFVRPGGTVGTFQVAIAGTLPVLDRRRQRARARCGTRSRRANAVQYGRHHRFRFGGVRNEPATITLATALPAISNPVTITGPGAGLLTVSRDWRRPHEFRIFTVGGPGASTATISGHDHDRRGDRRDVSARHRAAAAASASTTAPERHDDRFGHFRQHRQRRRRRHLRRLRAAR